jgi:hypothetical protein
MNIKNKKMPKGVRLRSTYGSELILTKARIVQCCGTIPYRWVYLKDLRKAMRSRKDYIEVICHYHCGQKIGYQYHKNQYEIALGCQYLSGENRNLVEKAIRKLK